MFDIQTRNNMPIMDNDEEEKRKKKKKLKRSNSGSGICFDFHGYFIL